MVFFVSLGTKFIDIEEKRFKVIKGSAKGGGGNELNFTYVLLYLFSNWLEVVYLAGLAVILWLGPTCLYIVLLVLLCGLALREVFQVAVSIRYIK